MVGISVAAVALIVGGVVVSILWKKKQQSVSIVSIQRVTYTFRLSISLSMLYIQLEDEESCCTNKTIDGGQNHPVIVVVKHKYT